MPTNDHADWVYDAKENLEASDAQTLREVTASIQGTDCGNGAQWFARMPAPTELELNATGRLAVRERLVARSSRYVAFPKPGDGSSPSNGSM